VENDRSDSDRSLDMNDDKVDGNGEHGAALYSISEVTPLNRLTTISRFLNTLLQLKCLTVVSF
jgi:hypothetical protein